MTDICNYIFCYIFLHYFYKFFCLIYAFKTAVDNHCRLIILEITSLPMRNEDFARSQIVYPARLDAYSASFSAH